MRPETLHRLADGRLLVADPGVGVLAVDPASGERTVLHAALGLFDAVPTEQGYVLADAPNRKVSWLNARGRVVDLATDLRKPTRLAVLEDGSVVVLDAGRLLHVEDGTTREVPVALDEPADLLATGASRVLVAEETLGRMREVDVATGAVTRTFDLQDRHGPPVLEPGGLGPGAGAQEVLVADTLTAEVTAVDLATGARRTVSQPGRGSGVLLPQVQDAVALGSDVAVLYPRKAALVRVSGAQERTSLSGPGLPRGFQPLQPLGVAVLEDGTAAVLDWTTRRILLLRSKRARILDPGLQVPIALAASGRRLFVLDRRKGLLEIDLADGSARLLAARPLPGLAMALAADAKRVVAAGIAPSALVEVPLDGGAARALESPAAPAGVALLPDGALLLTDYLGGRVLRVPGGEVAKLRRPWAVATLPSGGIVVGDNDAESLLLLDPQGRSRVLTRTGEPPGPPLQGVQALAVGKDGSILVADPGGGGLLRVDPATGVREPVPVDAGSH